jgi:AraC-like DNA-binding protein
VTARIALGRGFRAELATAAEPARSPIVALESTALAVLDGTVAVAIGDAQYELGAPALALANPGTGLTIGRASRGARLVVTLRQALLDSAAQASGSRGPVYFPRAVVVPAPAVALAARRIADELAAERSGRERALELAVELLALDLVREHAATDHTSRLETSRAGLVDRRLRRSVEFMHDNFARDLQLGEIAAAAYLSEYHFARLFKRITGQTPHAYLATLRVEHASRMLAETDLAISEVAERVGYQSASHFGKVFRTATGLTPTAYRDALVR